MSKTITIELADEVFVALEQMSREQHRTIEALALEWINQHGPRQTIPRSDEERRAARQTLLNHAGAFTGGDPRGSNNERIDADLGKAYGCNNEASH